MTTTEEFINKINQSIDEKGRKLIFEFFITFSRFECALKETNYFKQGEKKASPDWDSFVESIKLTFDKNKNQELCDAVEYVISKPPKCQFIVNEQICWVDRNCTGNVHELNKLDRSIRDIRNNLFHGGKFNGTYQAEISRNYLLLKCAIIILNNWLDLNENVKQNFLESIG